MARHNEVGKHKTRINYTNSGVQVIYHKTPVVTIRPDKSIVLRNDGWESKTTKLRMNQASLQFNLGFSVWQKAYKWYVDWKGETLPFENGMILS